MAETFPYPAEDRLYAGGLLPRQAAITYQFLELLYRHIDGIGP